MRNRQTLSLRTATPVPLPPQVGVARLYEGADLADAFAIRLPPHLAGNAEKLARCALEYPAPWVDRLMWLRDQLVSLVGLKTSDELRNASSLDVRHARRIGIFRIYEARADEVVLGEDDTHLDFRVSVCRMPLPDASDGDRLLVVTVVHCHNRLGRCYIWLIAPFHRRVVRSGLERAARAGWTLPAPGATAR